MPCPSELHLFAPGQVTDQLALAVEMMLQLGSRASHPDVKAPSRGSDGPWVVLGKPHRLEGSVEDCVVLGCVDVHGHEVPRYRTAHSSDACVPRHARDFGLLLTFLLGCLPGSDRMLLLGCRHHIEAEPLVTNGKFTHLGLAVAITFCNTHRGLAALTVF